MKHTHRSWHLLAALSLGGVGGVGATYNFAAPIYHRLMAAFQQGDMPAARREQYRSVQLVELLARGGFTGPSKAVMGMLGIEVGRARLPQANPSPDEVRTLRQQLEQLGFFDWVRG